MKLQTCIYKKEPHGPEFLGVACVLDFDMMVVKWIIDLKGNKVGFTTNVRFTERDFGNKLDTGA